MSIELIDKYFPALPDDARTRLARLEPLYREWNARINVISRRDMDHFYERHVLHSLGIARVCNFRPGSAVLDVGTGGGFPGIPLAICFPGTDFYLVDSIAKKIKVVQAVADALELKNVKAAQLRAEKVKGQYHYIVSRAVTHMPRFLAWTRNKLRRDGPSGNELPPGILYLKGGDLSEEMAGIRHQSYPLQDYFEEEFFSTKKVVYVPR